MGQHPGGQGQGAGDSTNCNGGVGAACLETGSLDGVELGAFLGILLAATDETAEGVVLQAEGL